jgi:trk system potassium uptake protein TrkA
MKILILGGGKVGETLCRELAGEENIFITVIEKDEKVFSRLISRYDIDGVCADGSDIQNLIEAGVEKADIFIAVSQLDEINLITAALAGKLGAKYTIARVRGEQYSGQEEFIRKSFGIDLLVNPDRETAGNISRNLRFPHATNIENFHRYNVDIVGIHIGDNSILKNMSLTDFGRKYDLLVCTIERKDHVFIPTGKDMIEAGDTIHVTGTQKDLANFYEDCGYLNEKPIKSIMVVGGGRLTVSLLNLIDRKAYNIKVIESDYDSAVKLSEKFEDVTVIYGDGTDQEFLKEENLKMYDCSLALTGIDEENLMMSVFAKTLGVRKIFTKLNRSNITRLLDKNEIVHTVITPKRVIVDIIIQFVRSLINSDGSKIEEFYTFADARVAAIQFKANENSKSVGKTLGELSLKSNVLVAYVIRDKNIFFPRGKDEIKAGDSVVIITTNTDFTDLDDMLEK